MASAKAESSVKEGEEAQNAPRRWQVQNRGVKLEDVKEEKASKREGSRTPPLPLLPYEDDDVYWTWRQQPGHASGHSSSGQQ